MLSWLKFLLARRQAVDPNLVIETIAPQAVVARPGLFLPALGPSVLEPHLNPVLAQAQPVGDVLPHERVRVVGLVKQLLQLFELFDGEVRPASPVLYGVLVRIATVVPGRVRVDLSVAIALLQDSSARITLGRGGCLR